MLTRSRAILTLGAALLAGAVLVLPRLNDQFRQQPACVNKGLDLLAAHGFVGEPYADLITDDGWEWTSFGHRCTVDVPDGTVIRFTD
jgi:hypothetical protein